MSSAFNVVRNKLENMPKELLLSFMDVYLSELDIDIPSCYNMETAEIIEKTIIPGYEERAAEEYDDPTPEEIAELIMNDLEEMQEE